MSVAYARGQGGAPPTDAELIAQIVRDNLGALGIVFDRHHQRVARVLARTGVNSADVDDLVQATFLEVPKNRPRLRRARLVRRVAVRDRGPSGFTEASVDRSAPSRMNLVRKRRTDDDALESRERGIEPPGARRLLEGSRQARAQEARGVRDDRARRLFCRRGRARNRRESGDRADAPPPRASGASGSHEAGGRMVKPACNRLWEVDALREGRLSSTDASAHERHRGVCATCRERYAEDECLCALGSELEPPPMEPLRARRLRAQISSPRQSHRRHRRNGGCSRSRQPSS